MCLILYSAEILVPNWDEGTSCAHKIWQGNFGEYGYLQYKERVGIIVLIWLLENKVLRIGD
jgi:hypothetical protein